MFKRSQSEFLDLDLEILEVLSQPNRSTPLIDEVNLFVKASNDVILFNTVC